MTISEFVERYRGTRFYYQKTNYYYRVTGNHDNILIYCCNSVDGHPGIKLKLEELITLPEFNNNIQPVHSHAYFSLDSLEEVEEFVLSNPKYFR